MPKFRELGEPVWTENELEQERLIAIDRFIYSRLQEGSEPYVSRFRALKPRVTQLLTVTNNLRDLRVETFQSNPSLFEAARYTTGPPISADDLRTLAQGAVVVANANAETVERALEVLEALFDPFRFPWLADGRAPSQDEVDTAIQWTTSLWCIQQVQTTRRQSSSVAQQQAVESSLAQAGWSRYDTRNIRRLEDLPVKHFAPESLLAGVKSDVPVRLLDGRLLAIECKVSNSSVNSIKRLNREVGQKASAWNREFGRQVIPAAVIAGVFNLINLRTAQENGITLFFDHRLDDLVHFVQASAD